MAGTVEDPNHFLGIEEFTLERPELTQFDWDAVESDDEPPATPERLAAPQPHTEPGAAGGAAEQQPVPEDGLAPSAAEPAVSDDAEEDFESSWYLDDAPSPSAELFPSGDERQSTLPAYRALPAEEDSESDVGSLVSCSYSVAKELGADGGSSALSSPRDMDAAAEPERNESGEGDQATRSMTDPDGFCHEPLIAVSPEADRGADVDEDDDDHASEASFHIVPGAHDRFIVEPPPEVAARAAAAARADALPNKITRHDLPPRVLPPARYGSDALTDERAHPYLNELPTLRAQLRSLGPLGEQLYALAAAQTATARRTQKHTPLGRQGASTDEEWWGCLLGALGLPAVPPNRLPSR